MINIGKARSRSRERRSIWVKCCLIRLRHVSLLYVVVVMRCIPPDAWCKILMAYIVEATTLVTRSLRSNSILGRFLRTRTMDFLETTRLRSVVEVWTFLVKLRFTP